MRPTVVLAMVPQLTSELFTAEQHARLADVAEVPDIEPLTVFADARAAALLARAEILLTGWGCPPIDAAALAQAPALRAIVHAAGTVKDHVTAAAWQRGLLVSSAAAANAVPVAEYTVAAILLANKRAFFLRERYRAVREFRWWPREAPRLGNYAKVIGLVGASAVGRACGKAARFPTATIDGKLVPVAPMALMWASRRSAASFSHSPTFSSPLSFKKASWAMATASRIRATS